MANTHTGFTQDSTGFHRIFFHKIPQDSTGLILLDKRPYSRSTGLCGGEKSCGFQNCQNILLFKFFFTAIIPVESCGIFCLFHKIGTPTRFHKIPQDPTILHSTRFHKIPQDSTRFRKIPQDPNQKNNIFKNNNMLRRVCMCTKKMDVFSYFFSKFFYLFLCSLIHVQLTVHVFSNMHVQVTQTHL